MKIKKMMIISIIILILIITLITITIIIRKKNIKALILKEGYSNTYYLSPLIKKIIPEYIWWNTTPTTRNMSYDIRGEEKIKKRRITPWNISSIEPIRNKRMRIEKMKNKIGNKYIEKMEEKRYIEILIKKEEKERIKELIKKYEKELKERNIKIKIREEKENKIEVIGYDGGIKYKNKEINEKVIKEIMELIDEMPIGKLEKKERIKNEEVDYKKKYKKYKRKYMGYKYMIDNNM